MANYYGSARSNYFRVKDLAALKEWCAKYKIQVHEDEGRAGYVALLPGDYTDDGTFPSYDHDTEEDFRIEEKIQEFLAEGSVAVFMEAGAEKLRYITGHAIAVNSKGQMLTLTLNDIYEMAAKLGEVTRAEY